MTEKTHLSRPAALILIVVLIMVDQFTKMLARTHLQFGDRLSYLADTVRLDLAENRGAFLSLGSGMSEGLRAAIFTGAVTVGVLLLIIFAFRNRQPRHLFPFSLIIGGGVGNLIDRYFRHGAVTDFMNVGIGGLRTGIFNVADMAITGGIIWLLVADWAADRRAKAEQTA